MYPSVAKRGPNLRPVTLARQHRHAFTVTIPRDHRCDVAGLRVHRQLGNAHVLNRDRLAGVDCLIVALAASEQEKKERSCYPNTSLLTNIANAMISAAIAHTANNAMQKAIVISSYGGG